MGNAICPVDRPAGLLGRAGRGAVALSIEAMVFPIVLGSGKRLFGDRTSRTALRLLDSPGGVFVLTYQPAPRP